MKVFEEHFKRDLVEIEEKIKNCSENGEVLNQLKKDKEYILSCLYPELKKPVKKADFDLELVDTKEEMSNLIINNQVYLHPIQNFYFTNKNDKKLEDLFDSFIEEDTFGLKKIYEEIISDNRLVYVKKSDNFLGCNTFIPSVNKNYIEIKESKKLYETSTKIHELGHAQTNLEKYNDAIVKKNNSFLESYPVFLELVFADYLKKNGKTKQGFELKFLIFQKMRDLTKILYDELCEYKKHGEEKRGLKYFFEYNYKTVKGINLSLYLYYLYKENPQEALKFISSFIRMVKFFDDKQIIKKFNLNKDCFNSDNVYKLHRELKIEKNNIKSR